MTPATQPGIRNSETRNVRWQFGHQPICSSALTESALIGWQHKLHNSGSECQKATMRWNQMQDGAPDELCARQSE